VSTVNEPVSPVPKYTSFQGVTKYKLFPIGKRYRGQVQHEIRSGAVHATGVRTRWRTQSTGHEGKHRDILSGDARQRDTKGSIGIFYREMRHRDPKVYIGKPIGIFHRDPSGVPLKILKKW
jgi:hypothetical protein